MTAPTLTLDETARLIASAINGRTTEIFAVEMAGQFHVRANRSHPMKLLREQTDCDLEARRVFIRSQRGYKWESLNIERVQRERQAVAEKVEAAPAPQHLVYGISRWSNPNRAAARHLDNGQGLPLCGGNGRKAFSWGTAEGEPTCKKCKTMADEQARFDAAKAEAMASGRPAGVLIQG